ncbi:hypothetical protein [uncultured Bradyrhizobium sp.]|jgi:hypothetical protein|nr:hypothetical protein [uncultured Bradyrhizobium sp.]
MAETKNLTTEEAQEKCFEALDKEKTTMITLEREDDGIKWTITILPD